MRRAFLPLACLLAAPLAAGEPALMKTTHVYKTVDKHDIRADVYRAPGDKPQPVLVWIHGGALITGNRDGVPRNLLDLCKAERVTLISIDYRLAPEVKLPEIIADVEDAFRWIGAQAKKLGIAPDRLVVAGGSAGGYLTLVTGYRVMPRPKALVAYWGYGDVDGEWYTTPSAHYRKRPLVSDTEAWAGLSGKVVSSPSADEQKGRGRFYLYLRQNGLWTKTVTGFDPVKDKAKLDPFCPVRNVTPAYPPTLLVHGTEDTDVPYILSQAMAREFAKHKVAHELVTVKGGEHGLAGADKMLVREAHARALAFIRKQLLEK
ncbi:MAG: alpha/beta hydrolase [Gemmataceae bacterium]